jgi:protein TonB
VIASIALHLGAATAYLWTPSFDFTPPPAASPISVSLVAPLAAPAEQNNDAQQASAKKTEQSLKSTTNQHAPKPIAPKPPLIAEKAPAPSDLPEYKEIKDPKKIPETQKSALPDKTVPLEPVPLKSEPPKPVPEKRKEESDKPQASSPSQMASTPSIEAPIKASNVSAPKQAKTSQHEKAAKLQWQQLLHAHLEREKRYPRKAKRLRKQGMPVIRFTMDRDGNVLDVILIRSSGTQSLDQEALDLVFRAQPLIKPPHSIVGNKLSLTVPINFSF